MNTRTECYPSCWKNTQGTGCKARHNLEGASEGSVASGCHPVLEAVGDWAASAWKVQKGPKLPREGNRSLAAARTFLKCLSLTPQFLICF